MQNEAHGAAFGAQLHRLHLTDGAHAPATYGPKYIYQQQKRLRSLSFSFLSGAPGDNFIALTLLKATLWIGADCRAPFAHAERRRRRMERKREKSYTAAAAQHHYQHVDEFLLSKRTTFSRSCNTNVPRACSARRRLIIP